MIPTSLSNGGRRWKFFRAGGFDQVKLDSGADLAALDQLDQKLWAALACPAQGLEFDAKTLGLSSPKNIRTKGGGGNHTIGARQSRFSTCGGSAEVVFITPRVTG